MSSRVKENNVLTLFFCLSSLLAGAISACSGSDNPPSWPAITRQTKPWTYWWWMGSAVDPTNLTRELQRYHDAGLGGVHIIPIYGAKGYEDRFITYLSPRWMEMLAYTVKEAQRLDLGVDMTMGTGWCFGGPHVTDAEANAFVQVNTYELTPGAKLARKFNRDAIQALVAFSDQGQSLELTDKISQDGTLGWSPDKETWRLLAVSQRPSGQKVKRAAPGDEGHMLNLFYPEAMRHYLQWFEEAFARYEGRKPRALYHDSYEYESDWAPDFFAQFEKRRGYRLQTELPTLFARSTPTNRPPRLRFTVPGFDDPDHIARVKGDYRETISELMSDESLSLWADWAHKQGFIIRNEAHGSPGNLLDLYAVADVPETEVFHLERSRLVCKFASSAAHVSGNNLAASETGTWLKEHFTETLADMKYLLDDFFLSGINHVFYHGTCYSPDEAAWPGWVFYASYQMNPRNSVWRDVPTLNAYVARCQAILQSGRPDNDLLVYWPIYDIWHNPDGLVQELQVEHRDWFEKQPVGHTADRLWNRGYAFDYVSDKQLAHSHSTENMVVLPCGKYPALLVPPTQHMPVETLARLLDLAKGGATVIFEAQLPADVPGWGKLAERRAEFKELLDELPAQTAAPNAVKQSKIGRGRIILGELEPALQAAGIQRESMFDHPGLMCVRRAFASGHDYFIANRSESAPVRDWIALGREARSAVIMDPLSGQTGAGILRHNAGAPTEAYVSLEPGQSLLLRCFTDREVKEAPWTNWTDIGQPVPLTGPWQVRFVAGGSELPAPMQMDHLTSWTDSGDTNAQRFAGTALYSLTFDAPTQTNGAWRLDLGKVCQSARVRLNGQALGTLITPPFSVVVHHLKPKDNRLEVEVTNVSANRIRDLDQRNIPWKHFFDINFVNIDYKPFDASNWPLTESGLLGPVRLMPIAGKAEN